MAATVYPSLSDLAPRSMSFAEQRKADAIAFFRAALNAPDPHTQHEYLERSARAHREARGELSAETVSFQSLVSELMGGGTNCAA